MNEKEMKMETNETEVVNVELEAKNRAEIEKRDKEILEKLMNGEMPKF